MYIVIGIALGLILGGLIMAWLSSGLKQPMLALIVYWVGVALLVIGLILLLTPVLIYINVQLRAMLGVDHP